MAEHDRVPLARPELGEREAAAVLAVLRSGMLVQGETVARFEAGLATATARRHAVAMSSGTAALQLALRAVDVGPGDEVLCPDLTWPSPAHAILGLGARPVLIDVDRNTWNVTPEAMAAGRSPRTRAAIVIDQFGNPAPVEGIAAALAGLPIVVDAACSLGSTLSARPAGSFGDVACMSFHPRKVITTGEGGVCLTDRDDLAQALRALRNHGQRGPGEFAVHSGNYRLHELSAALGCVQLDRLAATVAERRLRAEGYRRALPPELRLQQALPSATPNHQTMGALLPDSFDEARRDRAVAMLRARGVESGRLSFALHTLPHLNGHCSGGPCENAAAIARRGIALPLFTGMTDEAHARVIEGIAAVVAELT